MNLRHVSWSSLVFRALKGRRRYLDSIPARKVVAVVEGYVEE